MRLTDEEEALIKKLRADKITWKPKAIADYTAKEIREIFAELHALALEEYNRAKEAGYGNDNFDNWCSEAVLKLLGDDVFDTYNEFLR